MSSGRPDPWPGSTLALRGYSYFVIVGFAGGPPGAENGWSPPPSGGFSGLGFHGNALAHGFSHRCGLDRPRVRQVDYQPVRGRQLIVGGQEAGDSATLVDPAILVVIMQVQAPPVQQHLHLRRQAAHPHDQILRHRAWHLAEDKGFKVPFPADQLPPVCGFHGVVECKICGFHWFCYSVVENGWSPSWVRKLIQDGAVPFLLQVGQEGRRESRLRVRMRRRECADRFQRLLPEHRVVVPDHAAEESGVLAQEFHHAVLLDQGHGRADYIDKEKGWVFWHNSFCGWSPAFRRQEAHSFELPGPIL